MNEEADAEIPAELWNLVKSYSGHVAFNMVSTPELGDTDWFWDDGM